MLTQLSLRAWRGFQLGFCPGDNDTRAKGTLEFLVTLMYSRTPFDVDAVDRTMQNMVITKLRRNRNLLNEGGLIAQIEMQELPLLSTTISANQPDINQLNSNDPALTQAAGEQNKGEVLAGTPSDATISKIESLA